MRGTTLTLLIVIPVLFFFSSCTGGLSRAKSKEPMVRPTEEQRSGAGHLEREDPASNASLWRETAYHDLFKDLRAYQVGDLVTVNIVETSKASKKANTKTERQSSINAGISNALGWEGKVGKIGVPAEFNNEVMFKASMKNSFDGSGETSRNETMTASITARVMEVTPNGNLFIKGTRQVKVNNENQIITLTGLIRPVDVSPDNTVLSSYIADAKIEYTGSGPVSDKQRPGWLTRALDFVWPF